MRFLLLFFAFLAYFAWDVMPSSALSAVFVQVIVFLLLVPLESSRR